MDSSYSEDFYLSLVEVIQGLCSKFIKFQHFVEVSGYISVEIDSVRKENYVISELVKTSGNTSHSYCSHVNVVDPSRSAVGYSLSCASEMAKLPQDSDDRGFCPKTKAAGQKRYPVSFVRPLSTLNSNVSGQPPKVVKKHVPNSCDSGGSKLTQRSSSLNQSSSKPQPLSSLNQSSSKRQPLSSLNQSSSKPQPLSTSVQCGSSQNQLVPAQRIDGYTSLPPVPTRTQAVIIIDDNEHDIKPVFQRQQQKDNSVGNPMTTGSRLMSVPSNVTRPLLSHPRSAPSSHGQAYPSSSQIPHVSGHLQEISGHKRRHTIEPLTTESPLMAASIQGPLVSNKPASTERTKFDRSHIQSRRSMPIQLVSENPPVPKLRKCSNSVMTSNGAGVSTQSQPFNTSVTQQQRPHVQSVATRGPHQVSRRPLIQQPEPKLRKCSNSVMTSNEPGISTQGHHLSTTATQQQKPHVQSVATMGPHQISRRPLVQQPEPKLRTCSDSTMASNRAAISTQGHPLSTTATQQQKPCDQSVATLGQPPSQQGSRRPLIQQPETVASRCNSTPDLLNVDLKSTCLLPVVQLESLILPKHLDHEMPIAFHVAEDPCSKSWLKPISVQTHDMPKNDVVSGTENMDQGILMVQNTEQKLQFSPELESADMVAKGMPDLSSDASLVMSQECVQLGTGDMPLLSPQARSVQPSTLLSKSTSEEDAHLFENSDDNDSDLIDADLEEEIYLMQMKEEKEKREGMQKEILHTVEDKAEAVTAAPSLKVSTVKKKGTPDRQTRSLRTFTKYHVEKSGKEMIDLFSVSPRKLNAMLIDFFKGAKRADGQSLSPNSLRYIQLDLQKILNNGGYQYSLLQDADFQSSRYFLDMLLKDKNSDHAVHIVTKEEIDIMFKEKVLGGHNLISIRNSMWFMTTKYLGLKKRMQVKLKWGDILLKTDKSGKEYLVGPTQGKKAFADEEQGDCCFVQLYKMYKCHRPKSALVLESPFYLKISKKCNQYGTETISPNSISGIWAMMLAKASLTPGLRVA